mmetsp:Transcript_13225/g.22012  ORF Transcript_13225/g.22012 Transcript_13225/m.22012 type:complete len:87 (+) Transcript_13225:885-1145(+)
MMGGYGVYDHRITIRMYPLKLAAQAARRMRLPTNILPIFGSCTLRQLMRYTPRGKFFFLDTTTGGLLTLAEGGLKSATPKEKRKQQ